jgi:hypothetical protein
LWQSGQKNVGCPHLGSKRFHTWPKPLEITVGALREQDNEVQSRNDKATETTKRITKQGESLQ